MLTIALLTLGAACNNRDETDSDEPVLAFQEDLTRPIMQSSLWWSSCPGYAPDCYYAGKAREPRIIPGPWSEIDTTSQAQCMRDDQDVVSCTLPVPALPPLKQLDLDPTSTVSGCGVDADGVLQCWFDADPDAHSYALPERLSMVSIGYPTVFALSETGTVWAVDRALGSMSAVDAGPFEDLAASSWTWCGIEPSGNVRCGGDRCPNEAGVCPPPAGRYQSIRADENVFCALSTEGNATCWGPGGTAERDGGYAELVPGGDVVCAVAATGSDICWLPPFREMFAPRFGGIAHLDVSIERSYINELEFVWDGSVCGLQDADAVCWGYVMPSPD
jgi:hypothetical protein